MESTILEQKDRVRDNTSDLVNFNIDRETFERIKLLRRKGPAAIKARIRELGDEWDIERTLALNAASVALAGLVLGSSVDRRWYLLTGAVAAFLAQHAIQGWCPPLPLLRKMGVRTQGEIDEERELLMRLL